MTAVVRSDVRATWTFASDLYSDLSCDLQIRQRSPVRVLAILCGYHRLRVVRQPISPPSSMDKDVVAGSGSSVELFSLVDGPALDIGLKECCGMSAIAVLYSFCVKSTEALSVWCLSGCFEESISTVPRAALVFLPTDDGSSWFRSRFESQSQERARSKVGWGSWASLARH